MPFLLITVVAVAAVYFLVSSLTSSSSKQVSDKGESGGTADRSLEMVTNRTEQITPHFKASEFACRDACVDFKISRLLVNRLEIIRVFLIQILGSKCSMVVHSGYRCSAHNKAVGGATNSFHLQGWAADVSVPGMAMVDLHKFFYTHWHIGKVGGLGYYDWGVHVDLGPVRQWDERTNKTAIG